jgi:MFS family permease
MPWAPDRFGGRRLAGAALVFIIAGLAIMGTVGTPIGLYAGTTVMALGVAFFPPAVLTMAQAGIPALERGTLIGTTSAFIDLGFGIAPVTLGLVANGAGYPVTFLVSAVIAGVGLVLLVARVRSSPHAPVEAEPEAGTA